MFQPIKSFRKPINFFKNFGSWIQITSPKTLLDGRNIWCISVFVRVDFYCVFFKFNLVIKWFNSLCCKLSWFIECFSIGSLCIKSVHCVADIGHAILYQYIMCSIIPNILTFITFTTELHIWIHSVFSLPSTSSPAKIEICSFLTLHSIWQSIHLYHISDFIL